MFLECQLVLSETEQNYLTLFILLVNTNAVSLSYLPEKASKILSLLKF